MKTAKVTLADATYYLAFDGEAMFTLRDDFGGTQLALEAIEQDTRESFAATCAIAAVMAAGSFTHLTLSTKRVGEIAGGAGLFITRKVRGIDRGLRSRSQSR